MELSTQQQEALDAIRAWHARAKDGTGPQVFRLFGYAGTGKTTIAKQMTSFARKVQFGAFTGKAALVMHNKGCENARTIHSMIYRSADKSTHERDALREQLAALKANPDRREEAEKMERDVEEMTRALQQPSFSLNPNAFSRVWDEEAETYVSIVPPDLLCIDECSMIDKRLGQDLEFFKIPILVLGDPAQLPPVAGAGYFTNAEPDYLLTQIHRQAADNPVLKLATAYRQGENPEIGAYGTSRIVPKSGLQPDEWITADQILCGRNATRHAINRRMREVKGFSGILPQPGERLVCLRNNHAMGLLNGSMWEVVNVEDVPTEEWFKIEVKSLDDPNAANVTTLAHKKVLLRIDFDDPTERRMADEFDFGYCITTHKSQGSEWPNVIYIDEWPGRDQKEKARHRYTGVTRASDRITVVKW